MFARILKRQMKTFDIFVNYTKTQMAILRIPTYPNLKSYYLLVTNVNSLTGEVTEKLR